MKRGKVVFFVTGNVHKFQEARRTLSKFNIATAMLDIEAVEIQHEDIKEIAKASASSAALNFGLPVFVEDAGLFVTALKGFPGPYSSYVYRTVGTRGILKLMEEIGHRHAYFYSVVAFSDPTEGADALCFEGRIDGEIACEEIGDHGFGFDPIFRPQAESVRTFAQMTVEEKNHYSHRSRALQKFAEWYTLDPK